jgi:hypothetical protein
MIPKWPNCPPPRVVGTAWALAKSSRRSSRTESGVGVESGSNGVRGSCGSVANVVVVMVSDDGFKTGDSAKVDGVLATMVVLCG